MGPELALAKDTWTSCSVCPMKSSVCPTLTRLPQLPFQPYFPSLSARPHFFSTAWWRVSLKGVSLLLIAYVSNSACTLLPTSCFCSQDLEPIPELWGIMRKPRAWEGKGQQHGLVEWSVAHTWKKNHRFLGSLQDLLNQFWGISLEIYILSKHDRCWLYVGLFRNPALQIAECKSRSLRVAT